MHVDIELCGALTRGRTVSDTSAYRKIKPNVVVGIGANGPLFVQTLMEGLH